ncbi:MAG: chorismate mutase [Clostridiaceae bacterium]|nr:chorismate mutase [Clostridiaceae bacterium]
MPVRAIRGAITIDNNTADEILGETKNLLKRIVEVNNIGKNDIISVIFTATRDVNAIYPAVAAREMGWTDIALMCTNEMEVPGSLRMCIRVLMHVNTDIPNDKIKHVYLKGAKVLRPDLQNNRQT